MAYDLQLQVALQLDKTSADNIAKQLQSKLSGLNVSGVDTKAFNKLQAEVARLKGSLNKGEKTATAFWDRVQGKGSSFAAYSVASTAILKLSGAVAQATREAIKYESELIKISQVTDRLARGIKDESNALFDISKKYNVTISKVAELTRTLTQTGLSFREAAKGAEVLAKTSLLATFESLTSTTEGLIATMQTFNLTVEQSGKVLEKINAVSKAFAVESGDVVEAIRRTGGAFSSAGGQVEELIALFTSVRSTSRESAETIATGFRTIFGRLQRPKTIEYFKQLNIQLETAEGNFVGPLKAIENISRGLEKLGIRAGSVRFAEVVEQIGGIRQLSRVVPLLEQYRKTQKAIEIQNKASGSTAEDLAKAQKGLGYQLGVVKQEFGELISEFVNSSSFKTIAQTFLGITKTVISLTRSLKPLLPLLTAFATVKIGRGLSQLANGGFKKFNLFGRGSSGGDDIDGSPLKGMATGGIVPGSGNRDTVPAMLTPGEFVIRKRAVQSYGISKLRKINKYAKGGLVGGQKVQFFEKGDVVKTVPFEERQRRREKYRSGGAQDIFSKGEKTGFIGLQVFGKYNALLKEEIKIINDLYNARVKEARAAGQSVTPILSARKKEIAATKKAFKLASDKSLQEIDAITQQKAVLQTLIDAQYQAGLNIINFTDDIEDLNLRLKRGIKGTKEYKQALQERDRLEKERAKAEKEYESYTDPIKSRRDKITGTIDRQQLGYAFGPTGLDVQPKTLEEFYESIGKGTRSIEKSVKRFNMSILEMMFYQQAAVRSLENFAGININTKALEESSVKAGRLELLNQLSNPETIDTFTKSVKGAGSSLRSLGRNIGGSFGEKINKAGGSVLKFGEYLTNNSDVLVKWAGRLNIITKVMAAFELAGGVVASIFSKDYGKAKDGFIEAGDAAQAGAMAAKEYNQRFFSGIPVLGGFISAAAEATGIIDMELDARGELVVATAELRANTIRLSQDFDRASESLSNGLIRGNKLEIQNALGRQSEITSSLKNESDSLNEKAVNLQSQGTDWFTKTLTGLGVGAVGGATAGAAASFIPTAGIGTLPAAGIGAVIGGITGAATAFSDAIHGHSRDIVAAYEASGEAYKAAGEMMQERIESLGAEFSSLISNTILAGGSLADAEDRIKDTFGDQAFSDVFGNMELNSANLELAIKSAGIEIDRGAMSLQGMASNIRELQNAVDNAWEPSIWNLYQGTKNEAKNRLAAAERAQKVAQAEQDLEKKRQQQLIQVQVAIKNAEILAYNRKLENDAMRESIRLMKIRIGAFDKLDMSLLGLKDALDAVDAISEGRSTRQDILNRRGSSMQSATLQMEPEQVLRTSMGDPNSPFMQMYDALRRIDGKLAGQLVQGKKDLDILDDLSDKLGSGGSLSNEISNIVQEAQDASRASKSGEEPGRDVGQKIAERLKQELPAAISPAMESAINQLGQDLAEGVEAGSSIEDIKDNLTESQRELIKKIQEGYEEMLGMEQELFKRREELSAMRIELIDREYALTQQVYDAEMSYLNKRLALSQKVDDVLEELPVGPGRAAAIGQKAADRRGERIAGIGNARQAAGLPADTARRETGLGARVGLYERDANAAMAQPGGPDEEQTRKLSETFAELEKEGQLLLHTLQDEIDAEQQYLDGLIEMAKAQQDYTQTLYDAQGDLVRELITGTEEEAGDLLQGLNAALIAGQQGSFAGVPEDLKKQVFSVFDAFGDVVIPGLGVTGRDAQREISKNELMRNYGLDQATAEQLASKAVKDRVPIDERMKEMIELQEKKIMELLEREKMLNDYMARLQSINNQLFAVKVDKFAQAVDDFAQAISQMWDDLINNPQNVENPRTVPNEPNPAANSGGVQPPDSVTNPAGIDGGKRRHEAIPGSWEGGLEDTRTPEQRQADQAAADARAAQSRRRVGEVGNGGVRNPVQTGGWGDWWNDTLDWAAAPANWIFGSDPQRGYGYAKGGMVYAANGGSMDMSNIGFKPKGTDTIPAMLSEGEYVMQKKAVDKYGPKFFDDLNNGKTVYGGIPVSVGEGISIFGSALGNSKNPLTLRNTGSFIDNKLGLDGYGAAAGDLADAGVAGGIKAYQTLQTGASTSSALGAGATAGIAAYGGLVATDAIRQSAEYILDFKNKQEEIYRQNRKQAGQGYAQNVGENLANPGRAGAQLIQESSGLASDLSNAADTQNKTTRMARRLRQDKISQFQNAKDSELTPGQRMIRNRQRLSSRYYNRGGYVKPRYLAGGGFLDWIMGRSKSAAPSMGLSGGVDLTSQGVNMFGSDFAKRLAKDFNLDQKMLTEVFKPSAILGGDAGAKYLDNATGSVSKKLGRNFAAGAAVNSKTNRLVGRGGSIRADLLQHELGHVAQNNLLKMNNAKGASVLRGKDAGMQGFIEAFLKDKKGYEALKGNYMGGKGSTGMYQADDIGKLSHEMFTELLRTYGSDSYNKNKDAQNLLGEFFKQSGLQKQPVQKPSMFGRAKEAVSGLLDKGRQAFGNIKMPKMPSMPRLPSMSIPRLPSMSMPQLPSSLGGMASDFMSGFNRTRQGVNQAVQNPMSYKIGRSLGMGMQSIRNTPQLFNMGYGGNSAPAGSNMLERAATKAGDIASRVRSSDFMQGAFGRPGTGKLESSARGTSKAGVRGQGVFKPRSSSFKAGRGLRQGANNVINTGKNAAGRVGGALNKGASNVRTGFNAARGKGFAGMGGKMGEAVRRTATSSFGGKVGYAGGKLTTGAIQAGKMGLSGAKMLGKAALRMAGPAIEGYMAYNAPTSQSADMNNPNADALSNRDPLVNMAMGVIGGGSTTMGDVGARSSIGSMLGVEQGSMADQQLGNFSQLAAGTMAWQGMGVPAPVGAMLTTGAMLGQETIGLGVDLENRNKSKARVARAESRLASANKARNSALGLFNSDDQQRIKDIARLEQDAENLTYKQIGEDGKVTTKVKRPDDQFSPSSPLTNQQVYDERMKQAQERRAELEKSMEKERGPQLGGAVSAAPEGYKAVQDARIKRALDREKSIQAEQTRAENALQYAKDSESQQDYNEQYSKDRDLLRSPTSLSLGPEASEISPPPPPQPSFNDIINQEMDKQAENPSSSVDPFPILPDESTATKPVTDAIPAVGEVDQKPVDKTAIPKMIGTIAGMGISNIGSLIPKQESKFSQLKGEKSKDAAIRAAKAAGRPLTSEESMYNTRREVQRNNADPERAARTRQKQSPFTKIIGGAIQLGMGMLGGDKTTGDSKATGGSKGSTSLAGENLPTRSVGGEASAAELTKDPTNFETTLLGGGANATKADVLRVANAMPKSGGMEQMAARSPSTFGGGFQSGFGVSSVSKNGQQVYNPIGSDGLPAYTTAVEGNRPTGMSFGGMSGMMSGNFQNPQMPIAGGMLSDLGLGPAAAGLNPQGITKEGATKLAGQAGLRTDIASFKNTGAAGRIQDQFNSQLAEIRNRRGGNFGNGMSYSVTPNNPQQGMAPQMPTRGSSLLMASQQFGQQNNGEGGPMSMNLQGSQEITIRLPDIQALVNQNITGMIYSTVAQYFNQLASYVRSANNFEDLASTMSNGLNTTQTQQVGGK